jgi:hypothetical protein
MNFWDWFIRPFAEATAGFVMLALIFAAFFLFSWWRGDE